MGCERCPWPWGKGHIEEAELLDQYSPEELIGKSYLTQRKGIHHYGFIRVNGVSCMKIGSKWQVEQLKKVGWVQKGFGSTYWYMVRGEQAVGNGGVSPSSDSVPNGN